VNPSSAVAGQRPAPRAPRAGRTRRRGPAPSAPPASGAVEPVRRAGPLTRWWLARLPASDTWTLGQRNVYILPSRSGMAFAGLLLVMLLASINYQLNLGYVLTFLVAGAAGVSMHMTHATLRGLTLRVRPPAPGFAGDPARIEIVVGSPGRARHAVVVRLHDCAGGVDGAAAIDVPAQGQASATLALLPARRGWHAVPPVVVETAFPFGLFRAWSVWRPAARVLAWPRPEQPAPPLPAAQPLTGEHQAARLAGGSELEGVRAWRRGDTLRQIVWKKVARSGELVSRETASSGGRELWLEWSAAQGADAEARLARLAAWVESAERAGLRYGLRLPGQELPPAHGDAQRREALERLALFAG
jgi:uncharacterized protein (DUF58 family)